MLYLSNNLRGFERGRFNCFFKQGVKSGLQVEDAYYSSILKIGGPAVREFRRRLKILALFLGVVIITLL
jgi:hypothetical protein